MQAGEALHPGFASGQTGTTRTCTWPPRGMTPEKLSGVAGLDRQEILGDAPFSGSGLCVVEVAHQDNTNAWLEEADEVARLADMFAGCLWRDRDDAVEQIGCDGILIVTRTTRRFGLSRAHWRPAA